jgi:hypothetical protein
MTASGTIKESSSRSPLVAADRSGSGPASLRRGPERGTRPTPREKRVVCKRHDLSVEGITCQNPNQQPQCISLNEFSFTL